MDTSELIYSWKTTEMIKSRVTPVTASLYMTITVHAHDLIHWRNSLKKLRPTHGIQTHTAQEAHWGRQAITPVDSPPRLGHRPSSVILSWGAANVPEQLPSAHPPDQLTKILCPIISFPKPAFRSGVACVVSATLGSVTGDSVKDRLRGHPRLNHTWRHFAVCSHKLYFKLPVKYPKIKVQN